MDKLKLIILQGNVNASHKQSISLRFKVHYFDKDPDGEEDHKVGEAEVIFSAPRHPNRGIKMQEPMTWKDALGVVDQDLEANYWGSGPELHAKEVNRLTFCCCECCDGNACQAFSEGICGAFPQHSTSNQFFTPAMFATYHREGYRACLEAQAAEFLNEQSTAPLNLDQIQFVKETIRDKL